MSTGQSWFDISPDGWRAEAGARPLADLLLEAVQNSLDHGSREIDLRLAENRVEVEDDGRGLATPELAYTVFLSTKGDDPEKRGRHGRGLKDLLALFDSADLETVGVTLRFDERGRHIEPNRRSKGTCLRLRRTSGRDELAEARARVGRIIAPAEVRLRIDGEVIEAPRRFATLRNVHLDTVWIEDGRERVGPRPTEVTLWVPRQDEPPMFYELGIPIEPAPTPWHVDVAQRLPLRVGRDRLADAFRLRLLGIVFTALVDEQLSREELAAPWVADVLGRAGVPAEALRAYARIALPEGAVLPSNPKDDDRARQHGATVLEPNVVPAPLAATLAAILPTSRTYLAQQKAERTSVKATTPSEERAVALYAALGKKLLGRRVKVTLYRKPPSPDGTLESATFAAATVTLSINLEGKLDLTAPLSPGSLAIFVHELAHAEAQAHDLAFIAALERLAGELAVLLLREGRQLAEQAGVGLP